MAPTTLNHCSSKEFLDHGDVDSDEDVIVIDSDEEFLEGIHHNEEDSDVSNLSSQDAEEIEDDDIDIAEEDTAARNDENNGHSEYDYISEGGDYTEVEENEPYCSKRSSGVENGCSGSHSNTIEQNEKAESSNGESDNSDNHVNNKSIDKKSLGRKSINDPEINESNDKESSDNDESDNSQSQDGDNEMNDESDDDDPIVNKNAKWANAMKRILTSQQNNINKTKKVKLQSSEKGEKKNNSKGEMSASKKSVDVRKLPNVLDKTKEKNFSKTAARGVAELFNNVRKAKLNKDPPTEHIK